MLSGRYIKHLQRVLSGARVLTRAVSLFSKSNKTPPACAERCPIRQKNLASRTRKMNNLSSCTRRAPICFGEKGREKRIAYPRVRSGAQCSCAPAALYLIVRSNEAQEKQVHEFAI